MMHFKMHFQASRLNERPATMDARIPPIVRMDPSMEIQSFRPLKRFLTKLALERPRLRMGNQMILQLVTIEHFETANLACY